MTLDDDHEYLQLPGEIRSFYRALTVLPVEDVDTFLASAVCLRPWSTADSSLRSLVGGNLLEPCGEHPARGPLYRVPDEGRSAARSCAEAEESDQERAGTVRRLLDWYLRLATEAETLLAPGHRLRRDYALTPTAPVPFTDKPGALAWMTAHQANLETALRAAADAALWSTLWQLVDAMRPLFLRLRPADWWIDAQELGLTAAQKDGDLGAQIRMLTTGASALRNGQRLSNAVDWDTRALALARDSADQVAEAQALHGLGDSRCQAGRWEEAEPFAQEALELHVAKDNQLGAALARLLLGRIALATGRHLLAIGHLEVAHAELIVAEYPCDAARALSVLGRAHAGHGDVKRSDECLRQALEAFQDETGSAQSAHEAAHTLELWGEAREENNDPIAAWMYYQHARTAYAGCSPHDEKRVLRRIHVLKAGGEESPRP